MSWALAGAPEPACAPLYAAARKALDQPRLERTSALQGRPADEATTVRKGANGWESRQGNQPWRPLPANFESTERALLQSASLYTACAAGEVEPVGEEPARVYTYETTIGPIPTPGRMWISVARGLPLKVEGGGATQTSRYDR
ncbi:MAG: hypothetical protein IT178_16735 [Acidobacteria bacterium]|nr:hypothetical protein [Acidobacteriota bacterium]